MKNQETFIGEWFLNDLSICDKIIKLHKNSKLKSDGQVSNKVNKEIKSSTDVPIYEPNYNRIADYLEELQIILNNYIDKYKYCNGGSPFKIIEGINIQHYNPSEGFYGWHCERNTAMRPSVNRHLVFMTYLNDVDDGGETEFFYQDLKVKPQKGKTLIWPADWTHTHRGIPSNTQEKYIITGWFNYI